MRLMIRLILYLAGSVLLISLAFSYSQIYSQKHRLRNELQKRAEVLGESLAQNIAPLLGGSSAPDLRPLAARFANKDNLAGIAVFDSQGAVLAITKGLDRRITARPNALATAMAQDKSVGLFLRTAGGLLHLYAVPLHHEGAPVGTLLIVHDAGYIQAQLSQAWRDLLLPLILEVLLIALTTVLVVHHGILKPIAHTASWMRALRTGRASVGPRALETEVCRPLAREAASFAQILQAAQASAEQEARLRQAADSSWTAERLSVCMKNKLKGSRLFIASNREPYLHVRRGKAIEAVVPASGLVTALEPVLRACDGTWVAHGSGDADFQMVDERNCLRVPPEDPRYTLRRVWLSKEEEEGYYYGFSNEGLWPLCHIAHTRPVFRAADWQQYQSANAKFADALLHEMEGVEQPLVVLQDYHFALLPRMIKERRPDARVAIFWHIPWPNSEVFGICPWQRELLRGLLGADLLGFHIQLHCDNFLETVNRALEARVEWERFAVNHEGHVSLVRPFPISVVFGEKPAAAEKPFHVHQAELLDEIGAEAIYVGVGVDRVDYTKGILERFLAVERFLEKYPDYQRKFSFVQIGAPSRTHIQKYHEFAAAVETEAERINRRFQTGKWKPIIHRNRHHNHAEVERFYRAADFCLVTSLHDGMNLVAKEYIAARHDEDGVLILSPFTGASRELVDALVVNPYDTEETADAIWAALEMEPGERKLRMRHMRQVVKEQNVYRWAGNLIGELCEVRTARKCPSAQPKAAAVSA